MINVSKHVRLTVVILMPALWLTLIVVALNLTSPIVAGPVGILVVFSLFYLLVASILYVLIRFVGIFLRIVNKTIKINSAASLRLAAVLALGPIFLVALNTLGQIGFVEVSLVLVLIGLACFYVVRRGAD